MNATSPSETETAAGSLAVAARTGNAAWLAQGLQASRERTLGMLHAWREQLGDGLVIAIDDCVNPPRWEFGHVGWFEEWWIARNPQRTRGAQADPDAQRPPPLRPGADRWYDSSRVAHDTRWSLDMPPIDRIVDDVARQREATLRLLNDAHADDDALYFFRLVLLHEDMHAEANVMMAQHLGLQSGDALAQAAPVQHTIHSRVTAHVAPHVEPHTAHVRQLIVSAGEIDLGCAGNHGFAFDNEVGRARVTHAAFTIDAEPVTWQRFLPFVESGGYTDARWWSPEGRAWREAIGAAQPRHLRYTRDGRWEQRHFGRWSDLDPAHAASHLTLHEAQAWCRWAGRALPTEAQWCATQRDHGAAFAWGDVWEWTVSPFAAFKGFTPHPYRDYSQPWFDGRPVLKGASAWTHPRMRHAAYRNFFQPHRTDVRSGFRSVSLENRFPAV